MFFFVEIVPLCRQEEPLHKQLQHTKPITVAELFALPRGRLSSSCPETSSKMTTAGSCRHLPACMLSGPEPLHPPPPRPPAPACPAVPHNHPRKPPCQLFFTERKTASKQGQDRPHPTGRGPNKITQKDGESNKAKPEDYPLDTLPVCRCTLSMGIYPSLFFFRA